MMRAKIQLSPAEQNLITNADVILTKNRVLAKLKTALEQVQENMRACAPAFSKPHVFETAPKLSRGENYLGLPYFVLDYPRLFGQEDVFAIRSFFWWGRFFSSTLQLSGHYKNLILTNSETAYARFSKYHIGIHPDPWQHHFEPDNYQPIATLPYADFKKVTQEQAHIKIAAKWPVSDWQNADTFLFENWKFYLNVIL